MMGRKQFSYLNVLNIKIFLIYKVFICEKLISKNYSRVIF